MRAYSGTLSTFYDDINRNIIENKIVEQTQMDFGESQKRAFRNSLPALARALSNSNLPLDSDVAIELRIPLTCKRIDFVIAGSDENDVDHAIIVELKQWDKVKHTDMSDIVQVEYRGKDKDEVHPSWQAYTYESTISNFNEYVEKNHIDIKSCAFLHNYQRRYASELLNPIYHEGIDKAEPFIADQFVNIAQFISKYIKKKSKRNILFEIGEGRIKPSKMLTESLASMLVGNKEFELIDEQRIVYSNLLKDIKDNLSSQEKQVYIVRGGMGTGKTLIAMQLLSNLIQSKGLKVFYVAKSSYVKEAYEKKLTRDVPSYQFLRTLFLGSGSFIDSLNNEFDCLIVDEAHRLTKRTKKSYLYYGENQIKEIIHASKNSVFFIDETQSIDIKDYGTIENIKACAKEENAVVHLDDKFTLASQFRCNGSDEYIAWLNAILYNKEYIKSGEHVDYDIKIIDNIMDLKSIIIEKNKIKTSRMLSGDVFPWISMKDKSAIDININDFHAQWNKKNSFAVDPNSIDEVGCIHTSQGMDFDYVGLIIGDDFIYRNGKIMTDYSRHPSGSGEFKRPHQKYVNVDDSKIIDQLIRNTYKVLLTRGQKGTYLYIMDEPLKQYLKEQIAKLKQ